MELLTVEELRGHITSSLGEDELQLLLDAAEEAIEARYGPVGSDVTEIVDGGLSHIFLRRRALAITEITETVADVDTILDEDDYRLRGDGVSILRLSTGPNDRAYWGAPVRVKSSPADDLASRKVMQLALVTLDMNYKPGVTAERIGEWEEQRGANSAWNYETERESILAGLTTPGSALGFA